MMQPGKKPIPRTTAWIFFALFAMVTLVAGTLLDTVVLEPWLKERATRAWMEVPCTILSSDVNVYSKSVRGQNSASHGYLPAVRYEYRLSGQKYVSDRYWFSEMQLNDREEAASIAAEYPFGSHRVCFVDPQSPSEAVLIREGAPQTIVLLLFAGAIMVAGATICLASLWAAVRPRH
jgi:hypothetical protein